MRKKKGNSKDIRNLAEEAKISIRAIRRDGIDLAKGNKKNSEITEDELKNAENQIQKLTDKNRRNRQNIGKYEKGSK